MVSSSNPPVASYREIHALIYPPSVASAAAINALPNLRASAGVMIGVSGQSKMISRSACPSAYCSPMTATTISARRPWSVACWILHSGPSNALKAAPLLSHSSTKGPGGWCKVGFHG